MAKQNEERRHVLDPAVADLLTNMEQKQAISHLSRSERRKKNREQEKITARREQRATYDLPPSLRQEVKNLAEKERLPASQLVTLALLRFLNDLEEGEVDLRDYKEPSRSPRYDWNLVFSDEILERKRDGRKRK